MPRVIAAAPRIDIPALVEREAPALLAYFSRRTGQVDDAADLLGDTLVVVWRRQSAIPADQERARMWLYGVARKTLLAHRRSGSRRLALADKLRFELAAAQPTTENPLHDHVRNLVGDLDELDREIIGLVYWEGFSLVEVAHILSMRAATVRSRHARARARLHDALVETGDVQR